MSVQEKRTYEEKETRLNEILDQLDSAQIPVGQLGEVSKEAADLITGMRETLTNTEKAIKDVFQNLEKNE